MKFNIEEHLRELLKNNAANGQRYENLYQEHRLPAKTTLLEAGKVARHFHFIRKGCVRLWFGQDGKDITLQFFFDGEGVASIESFVENTPSLFAIETLEPTLVWSYDKADILRLTQELPALKETLHRLIVGRLANYTHLFLSRIRDTPQQRYENLLKEHPEIVRRVAQHYIASYLGITSVSLSRIRNRK